MIHLNFSNAEELVFYDTTLQHKLPIRMFSIFEQWRLAKRIPFLREMGKQAILDFLNQIDDEDLLVLEQYFNDKIFVEKLNYNIVKNLKLPLSEINTCCNELCKIDGYNQFCTWRDDKYFYISFWR